MKKILNIFLVLIIMLSMVFIPNVFAAEDVVIKDIILDSKSDNVVINSDAEIEGLEVGFDIKLKEVGDFVKYKLVVENKSNEDYEISNTTMYDDDKYIKYEFIFDDNSSIVKKNSTKTMYIIVTYNKEVPASTLNEGVFTANKTLTVNLGAPKNPKTGQSVLMIIVGLVLSVVVISLLSRRGVSKHLVMIFALMIAVIPMTIYAAREVQIKINSHIEIDENYEVYLVETAMAVDCLNQRENSRSFTTNFEEANPENEKYNRDFIGCTDEGYPITRIKYIGSYTWENYIDSLIMDVPEELKEIERRIIIDEFLDNFYFDSSLNKHINITDYFINGHTYYYSVKDDK